MANFNFNKVILGGRLCADPELKTTPNGVSTTTVSVAVNRKAKSGDEAKTDFISVVAWRGTAELIAKYFRKGSSICIAGSLQTRNWTDKEGNKRYATEVVADEAYFVDSKSESSSPNASYTPAAKDKPNNGPVAYEQPQFEEITDDDELPF